LEPWNQVMRESISGILWKGSQRFILTSSVSNVRNWLSFVDWWGS
jgi:hypothetical protein